MSFVMAICNAIISSINLLCAKVMAFLVYLEGYHRLHGCANKFRRTCGLSENLLLWVLLFFQRAGTKPELSF